MKTLPFFKGLSWLILLNLLIKPVWIFFIDRQVQNAAGNEAYGSYFSLLNLSYVLFFLADAGLSNMLNQRIAWHHHVNLRQLLGIKLLLLAFFAAACFLVAWLTGANLWPVLCQVVLIQALTSLFVFLRSIVTAHQYFTVDAFFSVIDKALMILLCGAFLYTSLAGPLSLLLFLQIQSCCTALAVLLAFGFIARKGLLTGGEKENIARMVRLVTPFALIILLMSMHYRLDGFLLSRLHHRGNYEAGIYASAYRLLDAGNMAGYLAASFLVPYIARHQKDRPLINEAVLHLRHLLMFFAIAAVSFILVFAPWVEAVLYHTAGAGHAWVMRTCVAALPAYYLVHIYGSVLTATGQFRSFIVLLAAAVLINLALNLCFIPAYGALGCCMAALASQYFCGIAAGMVAARRLQLSFDHRSNLVYLLAAALLIFFFYFAHRAISNVWVILALAFGLALVLLATQAGRLKKYLLSIR